MESFRVLTGAMYKFSEDFLKKVKADIDKALDEGAEPIAAFDADGTLWATDMGESFFKYEYHNGLIDGLPENPWEYYVDFHEREPEASYLWLAQINKGKSIEEVRKWARETVRTHPDINTFAGQKEIINHLHLRKVDVYVVTASIKWSVEPAAALYKIPEEKVLGVKTKIVDGIVTDVQEGAITYKQGKVEGLLEATGGKHPFYAAGNSNGDLPLLESATHLRMVLNSAAPESELYDIERKMIKLAEERNWYNYTF